MCTFIVYTVREDPEYEDSLCFAFLTCEEEEDGQLVSFDTQSVYQTLMSEL